MSNGEFNAGLVGNLSGVPSRKEYKVILLVALMLQKPELKPAQTEAYYIVAS